MTDLRTPEDAPRDEPIAEGELVPADDRIIGKAFVWSLAVFALVGVAIGAMVWVLNRPVVVAVREVAAFVPPRAIETASHTPMVQFVDITSRAGIDFVHVNGATGEKLLPETMGGGCAFLDFDNDGDADILLVCSTMWPHSAHVVDSKPPPTHRLYRNEGNGEFTDVTSAAGLDFISYGMGVACGDYDNDGNVDVFISALGPNHLLRNKGDGTFANVTESAGVAGDENAWSTSSGFFDYNNDGVLDLFVCNYVRWSRDIDYAVNYTLVGIGRAYGPPNNFQGANSYLYRNNGDGTFTDVSEAAGIHVNTVLGQPMGKALGIAIADIEGDGFLDVLVANDTVQRFLFHNQGDGTFKERGADFGLAFDRNGAATGAMGVDSAYYRNDRTMGFVIGNFANEMSSLLVAQSDPRQFSDEAITEGIGSPTRLKLTFGAFFFDYDLDGRLDLLHANGHIEDQINLVQASQRYQQPAQLFWNAGPQAKACFVEVPSDDLGDLARPMVGRGAAYADIDLDGDLDVLLTQVNGPPLLARNDQASGHRWLRLKLIGNGTTCNRDAIGARLELTVNGITQIQTVMPARSYLSQVELPLTFGLADADKVDSLRVTWPDGSMQDVNVEALDQTLVVRQQ
jgi:hypothetical protein